MKYYFGLSASKVNKYIKGFRDNKYIILSYINDNNEINNLVFTVRLEKIDLGRNIFFYSISEDDNKLSPFLFRGVHTPWPWVYIISNEYDSDPFLILLYDELSDVQEEKSIKKKYYFKLSNSEIKKYVYYDGDYYDVNNFYHRDEFIKLYMPGNTKYCPCKIEFKELDLKDYNYWYSVNMNEDTINEFIIRGTDNNWTYISAIDNDNDYALHITLYDELPKIEEEKSKMETNTNSKTRKTIYRNNNDILSSCVYLDEFLNDYMATPKFDLKDIKISGPATIAFWTDGSKTIVKCQKADQYDAEKGIIMAVCKGLLLKYNANKDWAKIFDIPYSDEIDVEKVIGLHILKTYMEHEGNKEWHYNYVLKYLYKSKNYTVNDEVNALKALGYSEYRIKKCLNITNKELRDALGQGLVYKKEQKIPAVAIPTPAVNKEETKKVIDEILQEDELRAKVIKMFNKGCSTNQIAKLCHTSVYYVNKYIDESTSPNPKKTRKRKKAIPGSKPKRTYTRHTEIVYPSWLEQFQCDVILAKTKEKYEGKYKTIKDLQVRFDRECKIFKINQCYGNGYTMYEIADIIGTRACVVQRLWNESKKEENTNTDETTE